MQLPYDSLQITPANLAELVVHAYNKTISSNSVIQVLVEMQKTGGDPDHIISNLGLAQVSDSNELDTFIQQAIDENPDVVAKIKAGKGGAIQFLMGQVMAKSKGKANPEVVIELLQKKISN